MVKNKILIILISLVILFTLNFVVLGHHYINHKVKPGENLFSIAQKYGSNVYSIKSLNNLTSDLIKVNQNLDIPTKNSRSYSNSNFKSNLNWPVSGRISSGYGYRTHPIRGTRHFHAGIDIAIPKGTRIKAVSAGKVVLSGWVQGFGKTIVIDHENGYRTLYAHNSKLLVKNGSRVSSAQVIALAGSTGNSTGPHLDFRIYKNGKTVNPLRYLP
ncbi:MAG: peptidoglycan DD-metalloendopeptidase family protein [Halanaerobiaceae bacterium]